MDSSPLSLSVTLDWVEEPTDASKCENCEDLILGKMYRMIASVNYDPIESNTKICESCYQLSLKSDADDNED